MLPAQTPPDSTVTPEHVWHGLLSQIQAGELVPIIGPDLLAVRDDRDHGRSVTIERYVARRLGAEFLRNAKDLPPDPTVRDVAYGLQRAGRTGLEISLYAEVKRVLDQDPAPIPDVLLRLAGIRELSLFVTTAWDDLLARAIDVERFGGTETTVSLAFDPTRSTDLPSSRATPRTRPIVYHMLGRPTGAPRSCAITDEDVLEFIVGLQSHNRRPKNLLTRLQESTLLILGSGFPDWLARFFLRVARQKPLFEVRNRQDVVAEYASSSEPSREEFLTRMRGQLHTWHGSPHEFLDALCERYETAARAVRSAPQSARTDAPVATVPARTRRGIFLSYASEDVAHATRIADALSERRLPVWLDKRDMTSGDLYPSLILESIAACTLFVPVISRQVDTPRPRFFFREWNAAAAMLAAFAPGRKFIMPCAVDDIASDHPRIPQAFRDQLHIEVVKDERALHRFVDSVESAWKAARLEESDGAA